MLSAHTVVEETPKTNEFYVHILEDKYNLKNKNGVKINKHPTQKFCSFKSETKEYT